MFDKNNNVAYKALQELEKESKETDCVYPYMDRLSVEQNRCAMAVAGYVTAILFFEVEVPKSKCSYPFIVIGTCHL